MWGAGADAGRIVFCPETSVPAAAASHAGQPRQQAADHAGHHPHAAHQADASQAHDHSTQAHAGSQCPFAVAAVAAPPAFLVGVSFVAIAFQDIAPLPAHRAGLMSWRAHPIRGPPALS